MPKVYGEFEIACPIKTVYAYLKNRYRSDLFHLVCNTTKGYIPNIKYLDEKENQELSFYVAGRDCLLPIKTPGWTWTYHLSSVNNKTKISITYKWSFFISVLSMFTAKFQAANELTETALALHALEVAANPASIE